MLALSDRAGFPVAVSENIIIGKTDQGRVEALQFLPHAGSNACR